MHEVDKIAHQLTSVANWLRAGKDHEDIRAEMYSAAEKTIHALLEQIEKLLQEA